MMWESSRVRDRITVQFDDESGTRGTVTSTPSRLARLFGRRSRVARVFWSTVSLHWCFVDGACVGDDLERTIQDQLRWRTVNPLPSAQARQTRTSCPYSTPLRCAMHSASPT